MAFSHSLIHENFSNLPGNPLCTSVCNPLDDVMQSDLLCITTDRKRRSVRKASEGCLPHHHDYYIRRACLDRFMFPFAPLTTFTSIAKAIPCCVAETLIFAYYVVVVVGHFLRILGMGSGCLKTL